MSDGIVIRQLDVLQEADIEQLADVLVDSVGGGASVSFMQPLSHMKAAGFWRGLTADVSAGRRLLLIAQDAQGIIVGTVQTVLASSENQPHRADISKMLVHRRARQRGIGAALMRAAETAARSAGRTLLVLDTATGSEAECLYAKLGWIRVGIVPDYALWPTGGFCGTTFYYRRLA